MKQKITHSETCSDEKQYRLDTDLSHPYLNKAELNHNPQYSAFQVCFRFISFFLPICLSILQIYSIDVYFGPFRLLANCFLLLSLVNIPVNNG